MTDILAKNQRQGFFANQICHLLVKVGQDPLNRYLADLSKEGVPHQQHGHGRCANDLRRTATQDQTMNALTRLYPSRSNPLPSFSRARPPPCGTLQLMDLLTLFGLFAVTAMLVTYALETSSRWWILAFAGACVLGSIYGFLQGAWPFGLVEAIWSLVAVRRWHKSKQKSDHDAHM